MIAFFFTVTLVLHPGVIRDVPVGPFYSEVECETLKPLNLPTKYEIVKVSKCYPKEVEL